MLFHEAMSYYAYLCKLIGELSVINSEDIEKIALEMTIKEYPTAFKCARGFYRYIMILKNRKSGFNDE